MKRSFQFLALLAIFLIPAFAPASDDTYGFVRNYHTRSFPLYLQDANPYWRMAYLSGSVWYVPTNVYVSKGRTVYYHYRPANAPDYHRPDAGYIRRGDDGSRIFSPDTYYGMAEPSPLAPYFGLNVPLSMRREYPTFYPISVQTALITHAPEGIAQSGKTREFLPATPSQSAPPQIAEKEEKDLPPIGEHLSDKATLSPAGGGKPSVSIALVNETPATPATPPGPPDFYALGNASKARGDFSAAINSYSKAILLNPENAVAFYKRALSYMALGRQDMAMPDFKEADRLVANKPCPWRQDSGSWICQSGF